MSTSGFHWDLYKTSFNSEQLSRCLSFIECHRLSRFMISKHPLHKNIIFLTSTRTRVYGWSQQSQNLAFMHSRLFQTTAPHTFNPTVKSSLILLSRISHLLDEISILLMSNRHILCIMINRQHNQALFRLKYMTPCVNHFIKNLILFIILLDIYVCKIYEIWFIKKIKQH